MGNEKVAAVCRWLNQYVHEQVPECDINALAATVDMRSGEVMSLMQDIFTAATDNYKALEDLQGRVLACAQTLGIDTYGYDSDELLEAIVEKFKPDSFGRLWQDMAYCKEDEAFGVCRDDFINRANAIALAKSGAE